jgi:sigma-B regulation protein RsbU (phosphoserine phosphatase)
MNILVAEDDPVIRRLLEVTLTGWGYAVQMAADGRTASDILKGDSPPSMALLDWMLPEVDGLEVSRQIRSTRAGRGVYIILLTARSRKEDVIAGLNSGADDYITKPFDHEELHARIRAGRRIVELQSSLAARVAELEVAAARISQLNGLMPICAWCRKVRSDQDYWQQVETYVEKQLDIRFTHGICPECLVQEKAKYRQLREIH